MTQGNDLISEIEKLAPLNLKEGNDPIGLQLGDPNQAVHRVMVTLDVRPEVVSEAIDKKIDFIFAHHPVMFHPAHNLDLRDPQKKMYADLLSHHITVYAAHTNLDKAEDGMNDWLAAALGLKNVQPLASNERHQLYKLAVFTPLDNAETLRIKMAEAGAGKLGNYSHASFTSAGQGRFKPETGAKPAIGEVGKPEVVQESKVEVLVPDNRLNQVVQAMLANHPYEEPAYDITPLANQGPVIGLGRIGELPKPESILNFAKAIKQTFKLSGLRITSHDRNQIVSKIAVIGGDGGKFYPQAIASGAEVLVTGDVYYHTAHDMLANGLSAIDPGHHIESIVKPKMTEKLQQWAQTYHWDIKVMPSELSNDPFYFI